MAPLAAKGVELPRDWASVPAARVTTVLPVGVVAVVAVAVVGVAAVVGVVAVRVGLAVVVRVAGVVVVNVAVVDVRVAVAMVVGVAVVAVDVRVVVVAAVFVVRVVVMDVVVVVIVVVLITSAHLMPRCVLSHLQTQIFWTSSSLSARQTKRGNNNTHERREGGWGDTKRQKERQTRETERNKDTLGGRAGARRPERTGEDDTGRGALTLAWGRRCRRSGWRG